MNASTDKCIQFRCCMSYAHSHSHILIRNFYQFLDAGFDRQRPTLVMAEVPLNLPGPRISFRAIYRTIIISQKECFLLPNRFSAVYFDSRHKQFLTKLTY